MNEQLQRDIWEGLKMLYAARQDGDQLRIQSAMSHLEFLDSMTRFMVYEERQ